MGTKACPPLLASKNHHEVIRSTIQAPRVLKFTLTAHAQTVIVERTIDPEWIERVLANPVRIEGSPDDHTLQYAMGRIPEYGNRVLRVVYNGSVDPVRVVTVYFDRKLRNKL